MDIKEIERIGSFADNIDLKKEIDLLHKKHGRENVDDRMEYIVYGLIRGIDVEKYIGPWLTGENIESIMENEFKKKNIDLEYFEINSKKYPNVSQYDYDFGEIKNPITYKLEAIDEGCLEYIIKLERGIDLFKNYNVDYDYDDFDAYISAIERYDEYEKLGYNKYEMYDIGKLICKGILFYDYVDSEYAKKDIARKLELYEMCTGTILDLNDNQIKTMINILKVNSTSLEAKKIKEWLEQDFEDFNWEQMVQIQNMVDDNFNILDIIKCADLRFDQYQMKQIEWGLEEGVDVDKYADPKFDSDQMREIRKGLEDGVDVSVYTNPKFTGKQMREIRYGLEKEIDVSKYADPKLKYEEMVEIANNLYIEKEKVAKKKLSEMEI